MWDERFLELAKFVSQWSKDPSTKVGAVLVDELRRVVGVGYNGFARGVPDYPESYLDRDHKYTIILHAEENALLGIDPLGPPLKMYVWPCPPCPKCASIILQYQCIKEVICPDKVEPSLAARLNLALGESILGMRSVTLRRI